MFQRIYFFLLVAQIRNILSINLFPYGASVRDNILPPNDDDTTGPIQLPISFPYFNENHQQIYLSNNGIFSFLRPEPSYDATQFPIGNNLRIIAGFWADVDTTASVSNGNEVFYGVHSYRSYQNGFDRVNDYIRLYFPSTQQFNATMLVVGTWYRVASYQAQTSPLNTFQIVLATDGARSYACFLYDQLLWTRSFTNTAATPAQAGFNAGDGLTFEMLPFSRTNRVDELSNMSNVNVPGLFIFRIDQDTIDVAGCSNTAAIVFHPKRVSQLGSTPITISGPCFDNTTIGAVKCQFDGQITDAIVIDPYKAICLAPWAYSPMQSYFGLSVDGGNTFQNSWNVLSHSSADFGFMSNIESEVRLLFRPTSIIEVDDEVTFELNVPSSMYDDWPANVTFEVQLNVVAVEPSRQGVIIENTTTIQTNIMAQYGIQTITVNISTLNMDTLKPIFFRINARHSPTNSTYAGFNSAIYILNHNTTSSSTFCTDWLRNQQHPTVWNTMLPFCPMHIETAKAATCCYQIDESCRDDSWNPGINCGYRQARANISEDSAVACYFSLFTNRLGAGIECCYNNESQLILNGRAAGSDNRYGPTYSQSLHFFYDELPFIACCNLNEDPRLCSSYFKSRPSRRGSATDFQWSVTFGDPYFYTMDGLFYVFNGYGEYTYLVLTNTTNSQGKPFEKLLQSLVFEAQIRTAPLLTSNLTNSGATVVRGFAAKSNDRSAEKVSVTVSRREYLIVRRGNQTVNLESPPQTIPELQNRTITQTYPEMMIKYNPVTQVLNLVWFIGVSIEIKQVLLTSFQPAKRTLNVGVSISEIHLNHTAGLLGVFDKDPNNDLQSSNGTLINSRYVQNLQMIHKDFGQTWLINPNRSLFYYESHESPEFYQNKSSIYMPSFTLWSNNITVDNTTSALCNIDASNKNRSTWTVSQLTCVNDYQVTGDSSLAQASSQNADRWISVQLGRRNPPEFDLSLGLERFVLLNDRIEILFHANSQYTTNIRYSLVRGPTGATFNNTNGRFSWQVSSTYDNNTIIRVTALDTANGLMSTHEMAIRISESVPIPSKAGTYTYSIILFAVGLSICFMIFT